MTAAASPASTTHSTAGGSVTRIDVAQFTAMPLRVSDSSAANAITPTASHTARPASLDSQTLCSGVPGFTGTRAPRGRLTTA